MAAEPAWAAQAYFLWRRRSYRWVDIQAFLALEGWCVPAEEIERVVMTRAGRELRRFSDAAARRKL